MSSLEDKNTKIDEYVDEQIAAKALGNWEWRRIKFKLVQEQMLKYPPVTIEEIIEEKDLTDYLDMKEQRINSQTYYLLKKLKELEERILKLENPKVVATK